MCTYLGLGDSWSNNGWRSDVLGGSKWGSAVSDSTSMMVKSVLEKVLWVGASSSQDSGKNNLLYNSKVQHFK